jgi:hypothetical protein
VGINRPEKSNESPEKSNESPEKDLSVYRKYVIRVASQITAKLWRF